MFKKLVCTYILILMRVAKKLIGNIFAGLFVVVLIGVFVQLITGSSNPQTEFHGYECTADCSGHQAGYDWAEKNSISDVDECVGRSQSFVEGCKAYVNENEDFDYRRD